MNRSKITEGGLSHLRCYLKVDGLRIEGQKVCFMNGSTVVAEQILPLNYTPGDVIVFHEFKGKIRVEGSRS